MKGRIFLEGVFQNFASSDRPDDPQNEAQAHTFEEVFSSVLARGHRPTMVHIDNCAAMLRLGPPLPLSKKSPSSRSPMSAPASPSTHGSPVSPPKQMILFRT